MLKGFLSRFGRIEKLHKKLWKPNKLTKCPLLATCQSNMQLARHLLPISSSSSSRSPMSIFSQRNGPFLYLPALCCHQSSSQVPRRRLSHSLLIRIRIANELKFAECNNPIDARCMEILFSLLADR